MHTSLLSGADYLVIVLYNVILIGIGLYLAKKKVKSAADFTTASQSLGTWTIAGSIISTCMGASVLFSNYQLIHNTGIAGMMTNIFWYVGWFILIFLVGKMRDTGASSIPDFISRRFGERAQKISAWSIVIVGLSTCAAQFKSFGTMMESLGIASPTVGIIIGASIIVLFTFFSGMWGSAVTNSLQSIFILIVCVVIVPLTAANAAGGFSAAMANVNPDQLSMDGAFSMTPIMFFSYMVSYVLNVSCEPSYSKYSLAAKDTKSAVKGQAIACAVCLVVTFWSATPALWIGQIFPEITDGSLFVPRLIATYMPVGIRGIIIAIILSLLITTGNSFLLLLTSSITDDVIRPMKPNMGDKQLLTTSRVIIAAGAAIIAALAIVVPDIVTAFKIGGNAFGPVVAIPVLLGFFWKKLNSKAVSYAMIIGCASSVILDIIFIAMGQGAIGNIFACAISLIICVAGSLSMNGKASAAA